MLATFFICLAFIVCIACGLLAAWVYYCNELTYYQRHKLIDFCNHENHTDYQKSLYFDLLAKTTSNDHFWALVKNQSVRALYSPIFRSMI